MTAVESMIKKMSALKIYDISEDSEIYRELCCYSVALDEHRQMLQEVLDECFIATAVDYGITNRESISGNVKSEYSIEKRREMLHLRSSIGDNDFTLQGFDRIMKCLGVSDYQITERYNFFEIYIHIKGDYSKVERKWIEKEINKILPAHIKGFIYFQGMSWKEIDNKNLTFSEMDEKDYKWSYINNL